jgi:hypothetical protein
MDSSCTGALALGVVVVAGLGVAVGVVLVSLSMSMAAFSGSSSSSEVVVGGWLVASAGLVAGGTGWLAAEGVGVRVMRRLVEERGVVPPGAVLVVVAEPLSENVENVKFAFFKKFIFG